MDKEKEHDLEEEFEEKLIKDRVTQKLLQWVRILVPLTLGAIGWYVSSVITPLDNRLTLIEERCDVVRQFVASTQTELTHINQEIINMDVDHQRDIEHNEKDIKELEDEVFRNGK